MHVVTVNDYLARRDSEWVGQVHRFLGLEVGLVQTVSGQEGGGGVRVCVCACIRLDEGCGVLARCEGGQARGPMSYTVAGRAGCAGACRMPTRRLATPSGTLLFPRRPGARHVGDVQSPPPRRARRLQGLTEKQRRAAYNAAVTYVTNSELGFDYLRDNLAQVGPREPRVAARPAGAAVVACRHGA